MIFKCLFLFLFIFLSKGDECPEGTVIVTKSLISFCIDQYEAFVVEINDKGEEEFHSPYEVIGENITIRAKVSSGVPPQGYISQVQASMACKNANKRLCTQDEFLLACKGADEDDNWYPYGGKVKIPGNCNEGKGSMMPRFFGNDPSKWTFENFNDPRLNQAPDGLSKSGTYTNCQSPYKVYDCVGNLHEWGSDPPDYKGHGRFRGGFYGDAEINGHGCLYQTSGHNIKYHDYSTGFRCCADILD